MAEDPARILMEVRKCRRSVAYFVDTYCQLLSEADKAWVPFRLWPAQVQALEALRLQRLLVILKARQLGFSWLAVAFALWLALLHPITTVLLFSKRDDEAVKLLRRVKGMYERLPPWLKALVTAPDSSHEWTLATGSSITAFPTTGGRSYTASLVVIDEADFVPDLAALLDAVKPTVDAGGRLVLLSTADKAAPQSPFKGIYRAAKQQRGGFAPLFLPWQSRPDRTPQWYAALAEYFLSRDGTLDMLHQEYPATDTEALSARTLDKRIAPAWVDQCYLEQAPLPLPDGAPPIPGLEVYRPPLPGRVYVVGGDPAEGNPTSDDSALDVLDALSGEQVASLAGKFQPSTFASHLDAIGGWYNGAALLVERNNHGHAVLLWLEANSSLPVLCGHDSSPGWLSSGKGKALLYDACADAFRHREVLIHSFATATQVQSIEGSTLRAPEGEPDDRADACALAVIGAPAALALAADDDGPTVLRA